MKAGRHPKLTYPKLRRIDAWYAERIKFKEPMKTIAGELGISINTLMAAAKRIRGYEGIPRAH